jgi:hypothetical protein
MRQSCYGGRETATMVRQGVRHFVAFNSGSNFSRVAPIQTKRFLKNQRYTHHLRRKTMKNPFLLRAGLAGLLLIVTLPASAYVGLCCAKCGGNMPMNILGGGIPETSEWRFKISPMFMHMDGLRDGTDDVDVDDILGMPMDMMGNPTGKYMAAPT